MPKTKVKAAHVITQGVKMGDIAESMFDETRDIQVLKQAVAAYGLASKTALAQVQYKKLTGRPDKSDFFED